MTRLSPERERNMRRDHERMHPTGHISGSGRPCEVCRVLAELSAVRGERDAATKVAEAALRRSYNPSCACGHGPREHRFPMDGGTGWCKAFKCKCDSWSPPSFDLAAEMETALAAARSVPVSTNEGATT